MKKVLMVVLGLAGCVGGLVAQDGSPWEVVMYRSQPYVNLESVQDGYGFSGLKRDGETFELKGNSAAVFGRIGEQIVFINRLRYRLHYAPRLRDGKYLISAYDLTNVLDLVLRPESHMRPRPLKAVYVQPVTGEFSTQLRSRDLALAVQQALNDYGIVVRFLSQEAKGIVGDSLEADRDGSTAWLRLNGNTKLPESNVRTTVLSPPGSPGRLTGLDNEIPLHAVYLGNLYDAESLALGTLIHSGLVLGPGARDGKIADAGITQYPVEAFQRASGPAVQIEWGEKVDGLHLLKSIVAGVLRYTQFLNRATENYETEMALRDPLVKVHKVAMDVDETESSLRFNVQLVKPLGREREIDPAKVQVQAFLFTREGDNGVNLVQTPPPRVEWVSYFHEWSVKNPEELQLSYHFTGAESAQLRREAFGHIVRVVYDGELQDVVAEPKGLLNQLWRFSAVFPK